MHKVYYKVFVYIGTYIEIMSSIEIEQFSVIIRHTFRGIRGDALYLDSDKITVKNRTLF